jgi:hypothetical protein
MRRFREHQSASRVCRHIVIAAGWIGWLGHGCYPAEAADFRARIVNNQVARMDTVQSAPVVNLMAPSVLQGSPKCPVVVDGFEVHRLVHPPELRVGTDCDPAGLGGVWRLSPWTSISLYPSRSKMARVWSPPDSRGGPSLLHPNCSWKAMATSGLLAICCPRSITVRRRRDPGSRSAWDL